jgi:16S rRNA (cytosine1402-N4)-methyltransferase
LSDRAHIPVLCAESVAALCPHAEPLGGVYIDCTFGRGGHARALLARLAPEARLIAFDRDPAAEEAAAPLLADPRFTFLPRPFSALSESLRALGVAEINGLLADLGVSSPQLDDPTRGFSFSHDGPLDMRMDPRHGVSAADWLAEVSEADLADTLYYYGEERLSRRIARSLVAARAQTPITRTAQLAELVAAAMPRREGPRHPATRTFQAIRIAVNAELKEVNALLQAAPGWLACGARMAVISFHSLEDRQVKLHFRDLVSGQLSPDRQFVNVGKPVSAGAEELAANPRARSARLRVLERTA